MAVFYGFGQPFLGGKENVLSRQEDEQLIRNDILQHILTLKGERIMRPDFGTSLRAAVFEPMTAEMAQDLEAELAEEITRVDTRVIVRLVRVTPNRVKGGLEVHIIVSLIINPLSEIAIDTFVRGQAA